MKIVGPAISLVIPMCTASSFLPFLHHTLGQYLVEAYYLLWSHFLLVWLGLLVLIVLGGSWLCKSCEAPFPDPVPPSDPASGGAELPGRVTLTDGISTVALLVFVIAYVFLIFYKENFSYYDEDQLTKFSLRGKSFPPPIWPNVGRFFPLHFQEFNALRFVTRTPAGYHAFAVVQLIVVLLALFAILRGYRIMLRVPILVGALLAPSFVISFTGLINPERNLLFWLAIMLLCLRGYSKTGAGVSFVGCLVATHFALYYKEPFVLFVVAYAGGRLLLAAFLRARSGQEGWKGFVRSNSLEIGMLTVAAIFSVLFLAALFPLRSFSYIGTHRIGMASAILRYLRIDWLLFILIAVAIVRLMRFVLAGGPLDAMWDPLAFAALAYFFCLIGLRMFSPTYTAPVDLVALLYLGQLAMSWVSNPSRVRVTVVAAALTCLLLSNAAYSAFQVTERKGVMMTNGRLGEFLLNYRPAESTGTVELFFPYADGYRLMVLSAYLRHVGVNVVGGSGKSVGDGPSFLFAGRKAFPGKRCVEYEDYTCVHADRAGVDALTVVLPDDPASNRDVEDLGKGSVLLLSAMPCPYCARPGSWLRSFHTVTGSFWESGLPEHWLELHVFKKISPARP